MSLTTAGLTDSGLGKGVTTHYSFSYDSSLSEQDGRDATNGLIAGCEADFAQMQSWFGGIGIPFDYPLPVQVTANSGGAGWTSPSGIQQLFGSGSYVHLDPGTGKSANFLRYLLVSEVTEMMMFQQGSGWFTGHGFLSGGDEGSMGEGLSRFLGTRLLIVDNLLGGVPPSGFEVAKLWLNGSRPNFVDSDPDDNQPDPTTGCTTLFIYYLFSQLGYSIRDIIQAGSSSMEGVYQNLRGNNHGWTHFIDLVNLHYPPGIKYHPAGDNIFPVSSLSGLTVPNQVICGYGGTCQVTIDKPAMAEVIVELSSEHKSVVTVPASVTIPVGAKSAQFTAQALAKDLPVGPKTSQITASYAGEVKKATVTVVSPTVAQLSTSSTSVICGDQAVVTVTLDAASAKGPADVAIQSSDESVMTIVSQNPLIMSEGVAKATFTVSTPNFPAGFRDKPVTASASLGGKSKTLAMKVVSPTVAAMSIDPNPVVCGTQAIGTVSLDRASNDGDVVVLLSWQPANFTPIQATLTIPVGWASASFLLNAPASFLPFQAPQGLLYASYDENNVSVLVSFLPSPNAGVLASLKLEPAVIDGGSMSQGIVTLVAPVESDTVVGLGAAQTVRVKVGSNVPLPSANVPASVTVPAERISATFPIKTAPLPEGAVSRTMTIYAGAVETKTATLDFLA